MSFIERPSCSEVVRLIDEWSFDPSEFFDQKEEFRTLFQNRVFSYPGFPPLFLRDGNEKVALAFFQPSDSFLSVSLSVLVRPDKRRQGYGSLLVQKVTEIAKEQNIERVVAHVRSENKAAIKLFKKAAYKESTVEKKTIFELELTPPRSRVFIIAQTGSSWIVGDQEENRRTAKKLIDAVAKAGADAIKFQTYRVRDLYAPVPGKVDYLSVRGVDESVDEILKRREMPYEELPILAQMAKEAGIEFMSTPFSPQDFDAVDPHVKRHKIASYEIAHLPLLEKIAESKKPVILSTGGSNIDEIAWSVGKLKGFGCEDLTLLQSTLAYDVDPTAMNLFAIKTLQQSFGLPVGLSDHSLDCGTAAVMAVSFGATVIEKQVTLSHDLPGPHQKLSLETSKLARFVEQIRCAEKMVGSGHKHVLEQEKELFYFAKRAVQAIQDIKEGEEFVDGKNVALLRPGNNKKGAHPSKLPEISGKTASHAIKAGEGVVVEDVL